MVLGRLARWFRKKKGEKTKAVSASEDVRQRPSEASWKRFAEPAKPMPSYDEIIEQQARRFAELVNESLAIAVDSIDPETRISRLDFAKDKLDELLELAARHPRINIDHVDRVRADIERLRDVYTPTVSFSSEELLRSHGALAKANGKATYTLTHMKDNLAVMQACMRAEIANYWQQPEGRRRSAAPWFFERAAILQRKVKNYEAEIAACEEWVRVVEDYKNQDFVKNGTGAKVWLGARHKKIMERLPKARGLLEKQRSKV